MANGGEIDPFLVLTRGNISEFISLLERGMNVNQVRWSGFSLLHRAAQIGNTDICQLLINNGADVNMRSSKGWYTPLHVALANGYIETAACLIDNNANPWAKSKYKEDPYEYGAKRGFRKLCNEFRRKIAKQEMVDSLERINVV